MELPGLTEGRIREGATAESFRRGQEYYDDGAVLSIARRGNVVEAEVEGSQPEPYSVRVELDEAGIVDAACDCPYSWGGWCKHIVAVLLFCLDQPGEIEERPPLEELLSGLDADQLRQLLLVLAEEEPRLAALIESRVSFLTPPTSAAEEPSGAPEGRRIPVDASSFARRVRDAINSVDYGGGWRSYSEEVTEAVAELGRIVDQARAFTRAGDARSALTILEAITREYVAGWEELDDSLGEASGLFYDLGRAWTEALLSVDLNPEEKQRLIARLEKWLMDLEDYGLDDALDPALEATEQGWDFPPLQRILRDGVTDLEEPEVEGAIWDGELISIRLSVLDRQGRHQEYLNLARAAHRHKQYAAMLIRLDRAEEAAEHALRNLTTAEDAEVIAVALREHGDLDKAVEVAQHGLTLEGRKAGLAAWLRDLAAGMGKRDLALSASLVALYEDPTLASYLRTQELAGDAWKSMRGEVLIRVRRVHIFRPEGQVDIFLHEGLLDDAIAVVDRTTDPILLGRVVDEAMESNPEWAIQRCRKQAESIMDEGRAQYYEAAAEWLEKARDAYLIGGRDAEWRDYLEEILTTHRRKYKLVPLLKKLAA